MATKKSVLKETQQPHEKEVKELIKDGKDALVASEISTPEIHPLDKIFEQRRQHRDKVLTSITHLMWGSFILLASLLGIQTLMRIFVCPSFTIIDNTALQVLSVSVFGEVVAVVYVISKALWDDKNYMELFK